MSKLKILLLGGIISILSIGYSSAISFSCGGGSCTPGSIELTEVPTIEDFSSVECSSEMNAVFYKEIDDDNYYIMLNCYTNNDRNLDVQGFTPGTYEVFTDEDFDGNITFNFTPSNLGGGDTGGGDDNTGGDTGGGSSGGYNLFTDLSNVVTGIVTVLSEFIPYVIYIGIGILICTLGFVAIRRLVNRLNGKVKSNFSSKRR